MDKFIAYYRVSTAKQGMSGLGMDAQREAVEGFLRQRGGQLIGEFREVESGKRNDRPALAAAIHQARLTGATLVIAKFDRLSRNAAFLLTLRDSGVSFVAADMPDANSLTVGIMALVAQQEREAISARTKAALAAAKRRGVKLGGRREGAADLRAHQANGVAAVREEAERHATMVAEVIRSIRAEGITSLRRIAAELERRHVKTARGGKWAAPAVRNVIARAGL